MSQTGILKKKRKNTECEHTSNQRNIFLQNDECSKTFVSNKK